MASKWRRLTAFWINVKRLLNAGNHDFCPGVNKYVYWLKRPIGWLLTAALASILVGVSIGPQGWFVLSVVTAVILLGVLWPGIQMWACRGTILVQQSRGVEGQALRVTLRITNRLPFPLWGLMIGQRFLDDSQSDSQSIEPPSSVADEPMAALARVPGFSITEFHWEHVPTRRGRFPQTGATIATGFPFGVWLSSRWLNFEQTCVVWPAVPTLSDSLAIRDLRIVGERCFENRAGDEGDFLGLRPYREGDPIRKIHWPQSVRSGNLVVRESEKAVSRQLSLLIDVSDLCVSTDDSRSWLEGLQPDAGRASQIKHARAEQRLRVALSVAESLWGGGYRVRIQLGYQIWETQGDVRQVQKLMDHIAEWSWADFFERWNQQRTINLRPEFVIGDWKTWHEDTGNVHLSEPSQAVILLKHEIDSHPSILSLIACCSPKPKVKFWEVAATTRHPATVEHKNGSASVPLPIPQAANSTSNAVAALLEKTR